VEEHVVRPFEANRRIGGLQFGHRMNDGQADAVHGVGGFRLRYIEVHRGQQVRSRWRIPSPVEAPPPCSLVVGAQNGAMRNLASFG